MFARLRQPSMAIPLATVTASLVACVIYVRTLLPGVSFGDWGEMAMIPAQLGIAHPTGYPLYVLLGKLFSLIPLETVAFRASLLSAVAAAGAVGMVVLILGRLGVRPVLAVAAALSLAFTGTLWMEATFSEMNGLHLLLVALLLHRALVWRAGRRARDIVLGGLLAGLCVSNHGLAITVVPIVAAFVLVAARRELAARPIVLVQAAGGFVVGMLPYAYIPLRALAGPAEVYAGYATIEGFLAHVSGAQFRSDMHFLSIDSLTAAWAAMPQIIEHVVATSNALFVAVGVIGVLLLVMRDRWFGALLLVLGVFNVYFYANYLGNLEHYLLATWLILAVGVGFAAELVVRALVERIRAEARFIQVGLLALPVVLLAGNFASHDQSANRDGERFAAEVLAALPQGALLVTYWDALTTLSYAHCVEGVRPDLSLRAFDPQALVTCDRIEGSIEEEALRRPVFALLVFDDPLRANTSLTQVPVRTFMLPWGERTLDVERSLVQLVPRVATSP